MRPESSTHRHDGRPATRSISTDIVATTRPPGPTSAPPPATDPDPVRPSEDDLAILRLLAQGLSIEAMARRRETSGRTIRRRLRAICDQLGFNTPIEAAVWAARRGLL
jgi:DNA-binding NarL/FixJ family response regulator